MWAVLLKILNVIPLILTIYDKIKKIRGKKDKKNQ